MSELMQLLTGAKPHPIPACAIRPINFISRQCLRFVIWSLEQHESDERELMRTFLSVEEYGALMKRNEATKAEIKALRDEYNSLLPVGVRRTWKTA